MKNVVIHLSLCNSDLYVSVPVKTEDKQTTRGESPLPRGQFLCGARDANYRGVILRVEGHTGRLAVPIANVATS